MNGVEVLKIIRSDTTFNNVPIIMLTSSNDANDLKPRDYRMSLQALRAMPFAASEIQPALRYCFPTGDQHHVEYINTNRVGWDA